MSEPWMLTYTGRRVNPLDVKVSDVCIEDVAHSLACSNRFYGHTSVPWPTAQHCVGVSRLVRQQKALKGLLHDGGEAYTGDMVKWLKESEPMLAYRVADKQAQRVVYVAFGIDPDDDEEIDEADRYMVRLEATEGYNGKWQTDHPLYQPMNYVERQRLGPWRPMDWRAAEKLFLKTFKELTA